MTNRNKQVGTAFETLVLQAFKNYYPNAKRNPPAGSLDVGDLHLPGEMRYIVECKRTKRDALPQQLREAHREASNLSDSAVGVVVTKRWGSMDPMRQLVHMELGSFLELVNQ